MWIQSQMNKWRRCKLQMSGETKIALFGIPVSVDADLARQREQPRAKHWHGEADNSQALFAGEEDIKSVSKRCPSNFWDRDRWRG